VKVKRGVSSIKEYLTPRVLVQEVLGYKDLSWNKRINLRNRALLCLFVLTGLRASELINLTKEQFDFKEDPEFIVIKNIFVLKKRKETVLNDLAIAKSGGYSPLVKIVLEYLDTIKEGKIFDISRPRAWQIITAMTGKWCHYYRSQRMSWLVNTLKGGASATGKIMKVTPSTVNHYYKSAWKNHKEELKEA